MKINYFVCHKFENPKLHKQMSIPSVMVPDPYQSSVVDTAYAHKVAQPPIRSEWRTFLGQGSNGAPSGNQSVFNVFPPSNTTIVDRRMVLRLEVTVTGEQTGENVPHALRAFPVNNVVNQVNVVINGSGGFVSQNNDIIYPLKRYIKEKEKTYYNSPTMLDTNGDNSIVAVDYTKNDGIGTPFYGLTTSVTVGELDVDTGLAKLSSNRIRPSEPSRAQFPSSFFNLAATGKSVRRYVISEVILNGVLGDAGEEVALTNISKLDITVLYESVQSALLMSSPAFAAAAPTVAITKAELLCHFITPSITTLPSVFTTGFKQYTLNSQAVVVVSASATTNVFSASAAPFTNLTLNTVPEFFYIYVKPQKSVLTTTRGDHIGEWTGRITNISINLGTSFGHLSQMDEHTLYLMSRDNGYQAGGFEQWQRMGSVLCIDTAKDLGLVPGQNRYLPIDFTVTFKNPTTSPVLTTQSLAMEICLLSVIPGTVNIAPDQCTSFLGFTAQDQGNAANDDKVTQTVMVPQTSSGSGFNSHGGKLTWSGVWKGIKQGVKYAAPVLQNLAAATGNPILSGVAGAAGMASDALGSGYKRRRMTGSGLLLG